MQLLVMIIKKLQTSSET